MHRNPEQTGAVLAGRNEMFSQVEQLVLRLADAITATPVEVSDELVAELQWQFSDEQLIELSAVIAHESYRARLFHALNIGSDNLYCELPPHEISEAR
jgi:alkylhydroperoxidase family enzyme